jgi:YbgC/YbaW family acyl-CoA thioester hydrolase
MKPHTTSLKVRGYELDSYQHVNNAVYLNYLEQARWEFFQEMNLLEMINRNRLFLVVIEINIRYQRELKLLDEIEVKTTIKNSSPYLIFSQKIYHKSTKQPVARANVKTIFVDEQRLPQDIPAEIEMNIK